MNIDDKDALEIFVDDDKIILSKYAPACIFCDNVDNIVHFRGKRICASCLEKLKNEL